MDIKDPNKEIAAALQKFEMNLNKEKEKQVTPTTPYGDVPKMAAWVMKLTNGAVKNQKQAEYILLSFVVIALGISGYLFFASTPTTQPPSALDLQQMKNSMPTR